MTPSVTHPHNEKTKGAINPKNQMKILTTQPLEQFF